MATNETNGDGSDIRLSGVYRHPDTGEELVTQATAKFGNPQADAITRLGFVYVGPADASKVEIAADPSAALPADTNPTTKSVDELEAELAEAKEREATRAKALKGRSNSLAVKEKEAKSSKEEGAE